MAEENFENQMKDVESTLTDLRINVGRRDDRERFRNH
jgi:hypothetical protein